MDDTFTVAAEQSGRTLAALVREHGHAHGWAATWNEARRLVERGKVFVDGTCVSDPAARVRAGAVVELRRSAPVPRAPVPGRIVHDDPQVVVFDKPAGVSSVPYEKRETGTAMDLVRDHWRRMGRAATETPLHVVHRIDKETSGLLLFAKTKLAERVLATQWRAHDVDRLYLCVAHGHVVSRTIESMLITDRGDGLRGSSRVPGQGKHAITHVRAVELLGGPPGPGAGAGATLCEVRLETGKTHQIRIHLAEAGHPLVGERVYIRDFLARGGEPIPSDRLLLHAATLGFVHPTTDRELHFESPLPDEFVAAVERLRRRAR